ncbi:hypothetical protein CAOG_009858 [Capsaspora owczarzaki ATCC 30864]|uniref:Uncharacterized protein n=1 Tax=Capsaspora owczarzaki (strain ATCC 30864) TaxID=595528 RepID=A0A0D2WTF2_CAPO3|nr:hypothetical protein CAOG_009858 [Capsaspora owczarzaki ATCC 30864]
MGSKGPERRGQVGVDEIRLQRTMQPFQHRLACLASISTLLHVLKDSGIHLGDGQCLDRKAKYFTKHFCHGMALGLFGRLVFVRQKGPSSADVMAIADVTHLRPWNNVWPNAIFEKDTQLLSSLHGVRIGSHASPTKQRVRKQDCTSQEGDSTAIIRSRQFGRGGFVLANALGGLSFFIRVVVGALATLDACHGLRRASHHRRR